MTPRKSWWNSRAAFSISCRTGKGGQYECQEKEAGTRKAGEDGGRKRGTYVDEDNGVRPPPDKLRELTSLLVTDVPTARGEREASARGRREEGEKRK